MFKMDRSISWPALFEVAIMVLSKLNQPTTNYFYPFKLAYYDFNDNDIMI